MPSDQAASLYGAPRPSRKAKDIIPSTISNSFASHLTSLLTVPPSRSRTATARPRPSHKAGKDDIFTKRLSHKGSRKRAADDDEDEGGGEQKHQTDIGAVDSATLHRSKRKMEEKARLYAAMKRGDYVPPSASHGRSGGLGDERAPLVDFDRKWAENVDQKGDPLATSSSDDDDEDDNSEAEDEMVDYTDEFGRTRRVPRREAEREQRRQRIAANAAAELSSLRARPVSEEGGLIHGDTVQSQAFNPDELVSAQIAALAARRDKSATPPPETHYDASKEVRSKGVGFYQFSGDAEGRKREMENLEKERKETERLAAERKERREKRAAEIQERRRLLREKREGRMADEFLRGLDVGTPDRKAKVWMETGDGGADAAEKREIEGESRE